VKAGDAVSVVRDGTINGLTTVDDAPAGASDRESIRLGPDFPRAAGRGRMVVRLLGWYLASRALVLLAMALVAARYRLGFGYLFREWDSSWYLYIAGHGYPSHPVDMTRWLIQSASGLWAVAFFPGFPLLIALLGILGIPLIMAGVAISLAGGFIATLGIYRLGAICLGPGPGERAALLFCFFPGAVVFSWVYTEGLSLALALACLYFLLRRRWLLAGTLAALAGAVHVDIGVAVVLACAVAAGQAVWRRHERRALLAPAVAPVGVLSYLLYLKVWTGSWQSWLRSEKAGWRQGVDFGSREIHTLIIDLHQPFDASGLINLGGALMTLVFLVALWRRPLPAPVLIAALAVLALSFSSSHVGLRPRALLDASPGFVSLGGLLNERETRLVALAFMVLTPLLVVAYLGPPQIIP
jgi:hypothetical protein